jgi:Lar family restriction alleviation protein
MKLKPCPFCGGTDLSEREAAIIYWIVCENDQCCMEGPVASTQAAAINKWNRRKA